MKSNTLVWTLSILILLIPNFLVCQGASKKELKKFKKKYTLSGGDYKDVYIYFKKKYGVVDKNLKVILKNKYDRLFYNEETHSVIVADNGKSMNDGGGKITTEYINIRRIDLNSKKEIPISDLNNYSIPIKYMQWINHKPNNELYLAVKNKASGKFNVINTKGDILLDQDFDHFTGYNSNGVFYAISEESINSLNYSIMDVNGKKLYSTVESCTLPGGSKTFLKTVNLPIIDSYGVTCKEGNLGLIDFQNNMEVMNNEYSEIILPKKNQRGLKTIFIGKKADGKSTAYNATDDRLDLKNTDYIINSYSTYGKKFIYRIKNADGLENTYDPMSDSLLFPIWYTRRQDVKSKTRENIYILTISDKSKGIYQSGMYDAENKRFIVPMSDHKIVEGNGISRKGGRFTSYYIEKNGNRELVKIE